MAQITPAQMRQNFPEFANQVRFPTGMIQFWLNWSYLMLNAQRFKTSLDMAAQLFTAHNLSIERRAMDEATVAGAANSGTVGINSGPVNSKSVDKVSVGYDPGAVNDPDAGFWNLTIYGARLWQLIQMFGAGPVQIGAYCGQPWIGSWPWPGWSGFCIG